MQNNQEEQKAFDQLSASESLIEIIEAALRCLDEGHIARAGHLLYSALPPERRTPHR